MEVTRDLVRTKIAVKTISLNSQPETSLPHLPTCKLPSL